MRVHAPTSESRLLTGALLAFLAMGALAGIDLLADLRAGTTARHVLAEGSILAVGLAGAAGAGRMLVRATRAARESAREARALAGRLEETAAEAARWRAEARELSLGLGAAIDRQFDRWTLSAAEREVGLLLLKGWSHREIARARSVTEATTRQQARALYRKAGLGGRSDLAAFFLEDMLAPRTAVDAG